MIRDMRFATRFIVGLCVVACCASVASPVRAAADPNGAVATQGNVIVERDVEYGRAGSRALKLDVYRPANDPTKLVPAILYFHGGGWRSGDKSSGTGVRSFAQT